MANRPQLNQSSRHNATIDQLFDDFAVIWSRDQALAERSVFDLWLHVVDHAGRVASAIRRERPREVIDDLADTTAWLLSFVAQCRFSKNGLDSPFRFQQTVSELVWDRYPDACPACLDRLLLAELPDREGTITTISNEEAAGIRKSLMLRVTKHKGPTPCTCSQDSGQQKLAAGTCQQLRVLRVWYAKQLADAGKQTTSIRGLEQLFGSLFHDTLRSSSLEKIAFRLMEEVGDVTRAIKDCYTFDHHREPYSENNQTIRREHLRDEIADLVSQIFALQLRIRQIYYREATEYMQEIEKGLHGQPARPPLDFTFLDVVWSKYGTSPTGGLWDSLKCPGCNTAPCTCKRECLIVWGEAPKQAVDAAVNDAAVNKAATANSAAAKDSAHPPYSPVLNFSPTIIVSATASSNAVISSWRKHPELVAAIDESGADKGAVSQDLDHLETELLLQSSIEAVRETCEAALKKIAPAKQSVFKKALARYIEPFAIAILANIATPQVQTTAKAFGDSLMSLARHLGG